MNCVKCRRDIPDDALYCQYCGKAQTEKKKRYNRANGTGTAYRRGKTWTCSVVIGWKTIEENGKKKAIPRRRTKGGFTTKVAALNYAPQLLKRSPLSDRTFKSYWDLYEENSLKKLSESKQTAYLIAKSKIEPFLQNKVADVGLVDLQNLVNQSASSYYTARDIKTILSHMYNLAIADQVVTVNLTEYIELPSLKEKESIAFTDEELELLWKDYGAGNTYTGYILLMIYTGMMPGEILNAKKDMIDWENQQIIGCGMKTAVRKETPIVIADFILPVLSDLCENSAGKGIYTGSKDKFYNQFRATIDRLGLRKELTPYSARHTTATALALGHKAAPSVIQKVMRHSNFAMTQRYIHPDTSDALEAVNQLKRADENEVPTS